MNRLSSADTVCYYLDEQTTTNHAGSLLICDGTSLRLDGGLTYDNLLHLISQRMQFVPRYRRKVREVTLGLARPVWVDDQDFDITYHVRRSALPEPGSDEQLHDLVARIMSRPLDRSRPLWEVYFVEGLSRGRLAILTKTHNVLVGGPDAFDISQVMCDDTDNPATSPEDLWVPQPEPQTRRLVASAVWEMVGRPWQVVDRLRGAGEPAGAMSLVSTPARRVSALVQAAADHAPDSPLNHATAGTRRFAVSSLDAHRCAQVAQRTGCTVTDVLLTVVTGAIRGWLLARDEALDPSSTVRAMVPLRAYPVSDSGVDGEDEWQVGGLAGFVTDLPVGEQNSQVRLSQVAQLTERHVHSGKRISLGRQPWVPDVGPATFHAWSARMASMVSRRSFNVPISVAEGSVEPKYVGGNRICATYPVPVLVRNRTLAIGLTSYGGRIYVGLVADRGAMRDLSTIAEYLGESFDELVEGVR